MRIAFMALASLAALGALPPPASAETVHPWCAYTQDGRADCSFFSYQQCLASSSRPGGCVANPEHALSQSFGMAGTPETLLMEKSDKGGFPRAAETTGAAR